MEKKIMDDSEGKKMRRFSKIENEKDIPFFKFYNPRTDPVPKQEKRKMKKTEYPIKKPKIRMKCFACKDKQELEEEEKKLERYIAPLAGWQRRENEERHRHEKDKYFVCKKEIIRLPSPLDTALPSPSQNLEFVSAAKQGKVLPEKVSMTESTLRWPPEETLDELMERVPKSRIIINKAKNKDKAKKYPPVDSIYYIYDPKYRKQHPWYIMYRGSDAMSLLPFAPASSLDDLEGGREAFMLGEGEEEGEEEEKLDGPDGEPIKGIDEIKKEPSKKSKSKKAGKDDEKDMWRLDSHVKLKSYDFLKTSNSDSSFECASFDGEGEGEGESEISKFSAATSIDSEYRLKYPSDEELDNASLVPSVVNRIMQKYQESETELNKKESKTFKRGTITSHSTSKICKLPEKFFFGVKTGTMHYGDPTFSDRSRYRQALPMCVTAYIYSFIKAPSKWTSEDINKVLDLGDKLYLKSLEVLHLHETPRILNPEDLCEIVDFCDRKIKYRIDDPDIAGFTRSEDPKIFNLHKGLSLFFNRNRSGILQTYNTNILIWKQKHYYVFDPEPRSEELYYDEHGHSILANLYDIPAVASMLLNRGKIENWPFIISKVSIKKVISEKKDDGDSITSEFREESLFKIIDPNKAVINGSLSIIDDCFGDLKNKQSWAVATMALVYNQVTPACSWHRRTIDKVLRVANQFYIECLKDTDDKELKLENLPGFFTIGPLLIEITVFANQYAGLMFKKGYCLFEELIQKFFFANTAAYVEIDKYVLAVWRFRDVFYTFDPYSRDKEGYKVKNGAACVTMNTNIQTLVATILHNFIDRDFIFKIHVMKIIKINRDPEYGKVPRNFKDSEESIIESMKIADKRAFHPKNITVDRTEFAIRSTEVDEVLDPSIVEIGSYVGSLDKKYVPAIASCPPTAIIKAIEATQKDPDRVIDLDSPTLSDTQIEKDQPRPNREDSFEYKLIEELYQFEEDLDQMGEGEDGEDREYLKLLAGLTDKEIEVQDEIIQKGHDYGIVERTNANMNTELLGLAEMPKIVLEPNRPPRGPRKRKPKQQQRFPYDDPRISQSKELKKPCNFILLPDGSEILYGTKNIARLDDDFEAATPFVSIVAVVMEKKYTLLTWTKEVVDAILDYGLALYKSVEVKFSDVPKIVVPRLAIGQNSYHVTVSYLFDSLLAQTILEQCLEKLVFRENEHAIIVTKEYSCAVFLKRKLFYMYEGFGCSLVGLGEGPDNTGVACFFRFKSLHSLVNRFIFNKKKREIAEPTEASRFIISTVAVKVILPPPVEKLPRREKQLPIIQGDVPKPYFASNPLEVEKRKKEEGEDAKIEMMPRNKVGYLKKGAFTVIEGSDCLVNREEGNGEIKACHFVGICAMIGIFGRPIKSWDTKRVDYVLEVGNKLFGFVDNLNFADKRNISNLLFDKFFFDVIVKRITVVDQRKMKSFKLMIQHLLIKNKFLIVQFPNCCFVLYQGAKVFHLFDPYGVGELPKACWIKFQTIKKLLVYFKNTTKDEKLDTFFFYTICVSKLRKASKRTRVDYKLRATALKKKKKQKKLEMFTEDEDWLLVYPVPWSRMKKQLACGKSRGTKDLMWYHWDVEYPDDLYSMISTIHQIAPEFPKRFRGKQTIANCIVAIVMTEIYNFTEWNTDVMDTIIRDGNQYFTECFKDNTAENYEIRIEDFRKSVMVFPYSVKLDIFPLVEGTIYVMKPDQFNLSKALRYFFEAYENRCGIICCNNGKHTKYLSFGRIRETEFFMYDCSTIGPAMFVDRPSSKAYILRCVTLNRLIHIMTVTLRSGDFFIYYVGLTEDQEAEEIQKITDYVSPTQSQAHTKKEEAAEPEEGGANPVDWEDVKEETGG